MSKRIYTIIIATALAFIICIAFFSGGGQGLAYDQTVRLSVKQIGAFYPYYSGNSEDGDKGGVKLRVECNIDTDELSYEYDYYTDSKTVEISIDDMEIVNEGTAAAYKYIDITIYKNSTLTFNAVMDKGKDSEGEDSIDYEVKNIDNKGPRLDKTKHPVPTREGTGLKWKAYITDDNAASHSANSGLKEVIVFRYNNTIEFDPATPIESLEKIFETKFQKTYTGYQGYTTTEFTMDKNGWYIVYMKDNLGNFSYAPFGNYTEVPQYAVEVELYGEVRMVPVDVALYEQYYKGGKGKVSQAILDDLRKALDDFIVTFQLERNMDEKKSAYFVLSNAVKAYTDAQINYKVAITNAEFLDGKIYPVNMDSVASMLPGDTLELGIIVTSYNESDIKRFAYPEVVTLAGISSPDKVIRLSYKLLKNTSTQKPKNALVFHIEFPEDATVSLVTSSDNNKTFKVREFAKDKNIIQFSSTESVEEFYFIVKYDNKISKGLIIGLSAGGGAVLAAIGIIVVLLYKRGKLTKKPIPDAEDSEMIKQGRGQGR